LNVNESVWQAILDRGKKVGEGEVDQELGMAMVNDETDEEEEEEEEVWGDKEFVSDVSDDDDGLSDLENAAVSFCL
jgi:protein MAK16